MTILYQDSKLFVECIESHIDKAFNELTESEKELLRLAAIAKAEENNPGLFGFTSLLPERDCQISSKVYIVYHRVHMARGSKYCSL